MGAPGPATGLTKLRLGLFTADLVWTGALAGTATGLSEAGVGLDGPAESLAGAAAGLAGAAAVLVTEADRVGTELFTEDLLWTGALAGTAMGLTGAAAGLAEAAELLVSETDRVGTEVLAGADLGGGTGLAAEDGSGGLLAKAVLLVGGAGVRLRDLERNAGFRGIPETVET